MNPELWKLIAAIGGVLVIVVTGPIIWAVRAELGKLKAELKIDIAGVESRLEKRITGAETSLDNRITAREAHLEKQMLEMEARLHAGTWIKKNP